MRRITLISEHASPLTLVGGTDAGARMSTWRILPCSLRGAAPPFCWKRFPDIELDTLQDPPDVTRATFAVVVLLPPNTVVPEITVLPMRETSGRESRRCVSGQGRHAAQERALRKPAERTLLRTIRQERPATPTPSQTSSTDAEGGERSEAASGAAMANDVVFAQEAAMGSLVEVEAGRLAAERESERRVKEFGTRMMRDHSAANQELMRIARSKGITLPRDLNVEQEARLERLHGLAGPEFDREYGAMVTQGHVHDVNMFEQQARWGQDPELRAYAQRTLPRLRQHLEAVRQLPGAPG
jgi:putative membrane protein